MILPPLVIVPSVAANSPRERCSRRRRRHSPSAAVSLRLHIVSQHLYTIMSGERIPEAKIHAVPTSLRSLRACLNCSMIKTADQFEMDGCDNCDPNLGIRGNRDQMFSCTSTVFDGMVALTNPPYSWVGKWLKINRFVPGVYAISVSGRLPADIIRDLKSNGETYRCRDRSNQS